MLIKTNYDIGDMVYLKTCKDQNEFMVTAICYRLGRITYELSLGTGHSWHDEIEISRERNIIKATS